MLKNISYLLTVGFSLLAFNTHAAPPYTPDLIKGGNRWTITAFDDSSSIHQQWATQGICFYYAGTRGTHQLYYWVSDTFPDWNGRAAQEGDKVVMHGDYAANVGHDGMEWELTTMSYKDQGFGHWTEWREYNRYGRTIGFLNTKFERVGKCRYLTFAESRDSYLNLELKLTENGEKIISPLGITEKEFEILVEQDLKYETAQ